MNDTVLFMIFFMVMTFITLGCLSFSEQKNKKRILLSEEKIKKEREEAIAKELKIDCTDFAVLSAQEKNSYMFEGNLRKYYSGENSIWVIATETEYCEVLFKDQTSHIVYLKNLETE